MKYAYEIKARPVELGSGWKLTLLEDGQEVGGGVFPPAEDRESYKEALEAAFNDAEATAYEWLDSRGDEDGCAAATYVQVKADSNG